MPYVEVGGPRLYYERAGGGDPELLFVHGWCCDWTAFMPQFIDPHRNLVLQFFIMAATFAVVEVATEFLLASLAHRLRPWLRRVGRRFNKACGGTFIAIGIALPLRS